MIYEYRGLESKQQTENRTRRSAGLSPFSSVKVQRRIINFILAQHKVYENNPEMSIKVIGLGLVTFHYISSMAPWHDKTPEACCTCFHSFTTAGSTQPARENDTKINTQANLSCFLPFREATRREAFLCGSQVLISVFL